LTGGFPFLLGGVSFQVLITTTLTITDVPKNMAVLRKGIDWAAVLREGFDRYGKRSLSGLHHRDGGGKDTWWRRGRFSFLEDDFNSTISFFGELGFCGLYRDRALMQLFIICNPRRRE
jgi:hypothetical protein